MLHFIAVSGISELKEERSQYESEDCFARFEGGLKQHKSIMFANELTMKETMYSKLLRRST